MKRKQYIFSYSGDYEGVKKFYKLARLKKFLRKIPEYELKNTVTMEKKGEYYFMGQYYKLKSGLISIQF